MEEGDVIEPVDALANIAEIKMKSLNMLNSFINFVE